MFKILNTIVQWRAMQLLVAFIFSAMMRLLFWIVFNLNVYFSPHLTAPDWLRYLGLGAAIVCGVFMPQAIYNAVRGKRIYSVEAKLATTFALIPLGISIGEEFTNGWMSTAFAVFVTMVALISFTNVIRLWWGVHRYGVEGYAARAAQRTYRKYFPAVGAIDDRKRFGELHRWKNDLAKTTMLHADVAAALDTEIHRLADAEKMGRFEIDILTT